MSQYPPNNSQPPNWQGNQSQYPPQQPWGVPPDQSGQWGQSPQWQGQQPSQPLQPNTGYQQPSGSQWAPQQQLPPFYTYPGNYQYPTSGMMPPPQPPKPPKKKLSRRSWIIIGVVVLILVIASAANANKNTATPTAIPPTATPIIVNSQATDTPVPTATPKPTPTAQPTPSYASFGDGTYQVGKDIQPGTYRTRSASAGCYYERLKGFSGDISDVIANDDTDDPAIITIQATDKGFDTQNCGTWTKDLSQITTSKTTFPDGMYIIGTDITPGTYKNDGSTGCYYARLSNFNGDGTDGIIDNNSADTPTIVTIASSDKGFQSKGCGTWTKI